MTEDDKKTLEEPSEGKLSKIGRAGLQVVGGIVPGFGGLLSAAAGYWGEEAQEKTNNFLKQMVKMLEDEMSEKFQTIEEIVARIDMQDEEIQKRITSGSYQSLMKKALRDWGGTESDRKREFIRNILTNAAASRMSSDDVIRLFLDWISRFSELHFSVIAAIYNDEGITRAGIWEKIGKEPVREDSSDADLFKLLIHDLSTGHIIRQHREVNYAGQFVKPQAKRRGSGSASSIHKSAFDDEKPYELTGLGREFVHYAMTDVPPKLEYQPSEEENNHD